MATVNCYDAGGCVIQHANELKWAHNEVQGLPEVKYSTILGLVGSKQFMFCPQQLFQLYNNVNVLSAMNFNLKMINMVNFMLHIFFTIF